MGLYDYQNPLELYVPKAGKNTIEKPDDAFVISHLMPVGVYSISEDLDLKYVFADLSLVQELLQYKPNQVSHLDIKLKSGADEQKVVEKIMKIFNHKVVIKNRMQQNDALYKMLNTENIAVYLIFTLVIIIALFNLIGALIMMILDKKSNLKTMLNLGASISDLRKIFFFQGTLLCLFGGIIGVGLASLVIFAQQEYQIIMITSSLPYPVNFNFENVLLVLGTIALLGLLASWIAASRVKKSLLG
jgi:lipoprotein-releasing system permease protein